jgi:hypothetical protein
MAGGADGAGELAEKVPILTSIIVGHQKGSAALFVF